MGTDITVIYPQLMEMNLTTNQIDYIRNYEFSGQTIDDLIVEAEFYNDYYIYDPTTPLEPVSYQMMQDVREKIDFILEDLPDI